MSHDVLNLIWLIIGAIGGILGTVFYQNARFVSKSTCKEQRELCKDYRCEHDKVWTNTHKELERRLCRLEKLLILLLEKMNVPAAEIRKRTLELDNST